MEEALVSAATGALKPVVKKLAALLVDEYTRFKGMQSQIKFLTNELAAMQAFLLKMSSEEDQSEEGSLDALQDKVWMKEVRDLSYDMEDSIDEFLRRIHHDEQADVKLDDGFVDKIRHSLGVLGKMKTRRRIGKEIGDLKKQIVEVGERNARYRSGGGAAVSKASSNATVDPRALVIFEHASKLVGIHEPKAEIIKLLMEEDGCEFMQQQLKVVSIVGSGGMGKTTLANQVYEELKGRFECRAFVSVSRTPNMMKLMRTILCEVTKQDYSSTEAGDVLLVIKKIRDFLQDKRYFIVVDDIWDVKTWDIIRCAFSVTGGSRIITTTRMKDVAQSCCSPFSGHVYNIRPLHIVHSRQLFHTRLFNFEEGCPSHLKGVSEEILEKCDGLPLAIIAISGLLANRATTKDQWNQVKNSIGCSLERNPTVEGMIKILSLSYFDLPPHLKTCLLYLSIFPEDYIIEKKDLIRRWVAEGFIYKRGRYTVHELGEMFFNELINRSLIQPMVTDENDRVRTCRVHDTILDFIISKSIEENFVTLVGISDLSIGTESKVRRISLQVGKQGSSAVPKRMLLSHVRSLHVFGQSNEIPSLDGFRHLRMLHFGDCPQLENCHLENIGRLFQLTYLNLRNTNVSKLPKEIGDLCCIEMLDLRGTRVRELPPSMVNLTKLVHLLVDADVKFAEGIGKMQALEMLKKVGVFNQSSYFLEELSQLRNLRKVYLDFSTDGDTDGVISDGMKAILSSLHNLCTLIIRNDPGFVLETCCPPLSLQKLRVWGSPITSVPNSVGTLINLQVLSLWMDGVRQEDLCILGGLPSLLKLRLTVRECKDSPKTGARVIVRGEDGFQCLRKFYYNIWDDGINLLFASRSMPKLEKLEIVFNAAETESLLGGDFDFGIGHLSCLTTLECRVVRRGKSAEMAKAAMEKVVKTHPNHPKLLFKEFPSVA